MFEREHLEIEKNAVARNMNYFVLVKQLVSLTNDCRFESFLAHKVYFKKGQVAKIVIILIFIFSAAACVAQLAEHRTLNPGDVGSMPTARTI